MSSNFWKSISIRTGFIILLGASLLTVALSWYFYNRTVSEQLGASAHQIRQLVATVESTAAVAAYLDNQELALEVVRGLANNDYVAGAQLRSNTGMQVESGKPLDRPDIQQRFALKSPFLADETAGELLIQPNQITIERNAREAANVHVLTMAAHSLALVVLVSLLVYWQLTRPLLRVAQNLHEIEPGSARRLPCPRRHEQDEIGQLIRDSNSLLTATQNTLEGERRLRIYAESLEKRFRLIFEKASCGIALMNDQGRLMLFNPSFAQIMQISPDTASHVDFPDLFADAADVRALLQQATQSRSPINSDLNLSPTASHSNCLHVLFSSVSDEQGNLLVECILYDISERAQREQQTLFEAERDTLTQLFNRRAGERRIQEALKRARADQSHCAVMLIDLDRFKPINDTYGHEAGDKVLVAVADRLKHCLRKSDIIIRWGGDEFLVLVLEGNDAMAASVVAEKILDGLRQDIDLGNGRQGHIGASIGIAMFPEHGVQSQELISLADQAMYQVKQGGRNGFAYYHADSDADL